MMTKEQIIKSAIFSVIAILSVSFSSLIYFSYQNFINPEHVYGNWIEIGSPKYDTDILLLSDSGVYRNKRLITTRFDFNGEKIEIETGKGMFIYELAGTPNSPQLKRIYPNSPTKRFIKEGYEDTVSNESGGGKNRRAALSEHFSQP
ncbi:DUF2850 domain-containing protein [Vibrio genomosp. F10]|uniref:DUF2850 domain-containing protein n=1 Tax=Vibrio genomosp. F10 TaxID=723171 RepID=UPI0002F32CBE|nr:DUF2850 domain-containing protein [Vibrio genomosp. F10]OEE98441.1 hypothetical protein A1QK_12305 [Vibrio genomosp. F10 str. 9ZD137]